MKTFSQFIEECYLSEGKIPWDSGQHPLRSGWTPREKNMAKRKSLKVEDPNHSPSEKHLERYGRLSLEHDHQKNVKRDKSIEHKDERDYDYPRMGVNAILGQARRMPSDNIKGSPPIPRNSSAGKNNPTQSDFKKTLNDMKTREFGAKNDTHRDKYYEKGPKSLKEPKK